MPDLTHLWQRFLLACSLVVGLLIGVAVTVFGYGNRTAVDVHWSIFHIDGVPVWMVAVVPVAILLIAGTLYHWLDGLHHFSEHMRHRHRVHELEAEVASLRAHLDQVLDMPEGSVSKLPRRSVTIESEPAPALAPAEPTPAPTKTKKGPAPTQGPELVGINGGHKTTATEPAP